MIKDKQIAKEYRKMIKKRVVTISFNAEEKTLLDVAMNKEGWDNVSGFIKHKLFGLAIDEKIQKLTTSKRPKEVPILLFNELKQLNEQLTFQNYRYEKDMQQLYREPGVISQVWIDATKKYHVEAIDIMKDIYKMCEVIARNLGIDISHLYPKTHLEKKAVDIDAWKKVSEELYEQNPIAIARDLMKEQGNEGEV